MAGAGSRPDFNDAVERLEDTERRLSGEDSETTDPEDARHWASVYGELLGFKKGLLEQARLRGAPLAGAAREEVANDLTILEAEWKRLKARHDFWSRRAVELKRKSRAVRRS